MGELKRSRFVYHKWRTMGLAAPFNWIGYCAFISQKGTLIYKGSSPYSPILSLKSLCDFFPPISNNKVINKNEPEPSVLEGD